MCYLIVSSIFLLDTFQRLWSVAALRLVRLKWILHDIRQTHIGLFDEFIKLKIVHMKRLGGVNKPKSFASPLSSVTAWLDNKVVRQCHLLDISNGTKRSHQARRQPRVSYGEAFGEKFNSIHTGHFVKVRTWSHTVLVECSYRSIFYIQIHCNNCIILKERWTALFFSSEADAP